VATEAAVGTQQTTLLQLQRFAAALPDELRALCTHPEGLSQFEFITQPAKPPDLNVLDQGAWTSLQVAVDAVKDQESRGLMQLNETELYQAMLTGWDEWCKISSTKLTSSSPCSNSTPRRSWMPGW
jgi:hypothetical protein